MIHHSNMSTIRSLAGCQHRRTLSPCATMFRSMWLNTRVRLFLTYWVIPLLGSNSSTGHFHCRLKAKGDSTWGGKVVASPPDVFKKTISAIIPILLEKKETPCVVVPLIPRYLFSRCCNDSGHCTNVNDVDFCETLLTGFLQQRGDLIKTLVAAGVTNFKVLDACCTTTCATTANTKTRLTDLRCV
jgi:hypothetical protein